MTECDKIDTFQSRKLDVYVFCYYFVSITSELDIKFNYILYVLDIASEFVYVLYYIFTLVDLMTSAVELSMNEII